MASAIDVLALIGEGDSPFSIALRNRLQDLSLRQDMEVDEGAKRATLAHRVRLYALAVTKRIEDEAEAEG